MKALSLALLGALASAAFSAELNTPVGIWQTVDEQSGKPSAIVEVFQDGSELKAKIIKVLKEPEPPKPQVCDRCSGELKDKPLVGLTFMWGLHPDGSEWGGGEILDPKNGNVYKAKLELIDGGNKLKVRGFLGFSLLGRTQIWHREKN